VARIIKAGPNQVVIPAPVASAKAQAEAIVASAEAVREAARQEGYAAGREAGLASVTALLAAARAEVDRRAQGAEAELRRLAVRIAEKILARTLALGPDAVVDVVRGALAAAAERRDLVVRVHPDDVAVVVEARERLLAGAAARAHLAVRADATVGRGGCIVETEVGSIDARLDVQLAAIERALLGDGEPR
jgi:flagellar biosynthesis/type III secretory pathway protein FliH